MAAARKDHGGPAADVGVVGGAEPVEDEATQAAMAFGQCPVGTVEVSSRRCCHARSGTGFRENYGLLAKFQTDGRALQVSRADPSRAVTAGRQASRSRPVGGAVALPRHTPWRHTCKINSFEPLRSLPEEFLKQTSKKKSSDLHVSTAVASG